MGQVINWEGRAPRDRDLNEKLISSACAGDARRLKELLDNGADPSYRSPGGNTALHSAYEWGHSNVLNILIKRGANVNVGDKYHRTLLALAAERGDYNTVSLLISNGADVNTVDSRYSSTPLNRAIVKGQGGIVGLLLAKGADPNLPDIMGQTALTRAYNWGRLEIARMLETYGAMPSRIARKADRDYKIRELGHRARFSGAKTRPGQIQEQERDQEKEKEQDKRDHEDKALQALRDKGDNLLRRLVKTAPGRDEASAYERLCVEILQFCFDPYLRDPGAQLVSDDELDRLDAIFTVGRGHPFWDSVRSDFKSRFAVAEFKNRTPSTGQTEVESIEQYLHDHAMRLFGILMARTQPSDSALKARRRAWNASRKMIVILDDELVKKMIHLKIDGKDPSDVLNMQIDDFLRKLTP